MYIYNIYKCRAPVGRQSAASDERGRGASRPSASPFFLLARAPAPALFALASPSPLAVPHYSSMLASRTLPLLLRAAIRARLSLHFFVSGSSSNCNCVFYFCCVSVP